MLKPQPKDPEIIQAQIATFAAEHVEHYRDSGYIYSNLGNLAVGGVEDVTRTTTSKEYYHKDENGSEFDIPEGTQKTAATAAEYSAFLRSVGGSSYEPIKIRADMLSEYSIFAPAIATLITELSDPATREQHPAFLGSGSNAMAFKITAQDKDYAVRVPRGSKPDAGSIDDHLAGAVLGRGVPHLEQIVAASYEYGVTVAELMSGKEVGNLTLEEIRAISDEQLEELVDTVVLANERGIEIDPKPSNVFYDPVSGYGIVDYHSSKRAGKNSKDQSIGETVSWMSTVITSSGFYGKPYNFEKTKDDYAHDLEFRQANLATLIRFRTVVSKKLSGEELPTALAWIDEKVEEEKERVDSYSDPNWVSDVIATAEERKRQNEERTENPVTELTPAGGDFI